VVLPTSYISTLLLLILSFVCLGCWVNTFKLTGPRWRFELFSIDFAVGAALLSVIAAFTLGLLGSDLGFTDRMLVAGHLAQVFLIAAGSIFNLGNMLLLAATSILGTAAAFPLGIGVALVVSSLLNFRGNNELLLVSGIVLVMIAVLLDGSSLQVSDRVTKAAAPKDSRETFAAAGLGGTDGKPSTSTGTMGTARKVVNSNVRKANGRKRTKGFVVGTLAGVALGLFYPVADKGMAGDFGLGPYAGVLLFSVGVLLSTIMFDFYFLNIAIDAEPLSFGAYFRGKARQHFLGFAGGAIWAAGMLAASLAISAHKQVGLSPALAFILPVASVLLVVLSGSVVWKEFASVPAKAKLSLGLSAAALACGLILIGIGITR
jgi:glucose uptake protein